MNIFNMNIKSSFKYQVIFFLSSAIHITFLIVFLINKIYVLAGVNVFSIIFYLSGGIASKAKIFIKHNMAWILSIYIEITAHAVLSTLWLGFETCFFLYSMVALTVASYVVYLSCDKSTFLKVIIPLAETSFASLIFCFIFLIIKPPLITLLFNNTITYDQVQAMRGVNIFLNFFIIFFFSIVFIAEMHSLMEKLEETNNKLNYMANHDALTDLYNRHSLKELFIKFKNNYCGAEVCNIRNNNFNDEDCESISYCVIMGDIDNFKSINDTYGHSYGDLVLKGVSTVIKNSVAEKEIACRWGGEEFLILMNGQKEECTKRVEEIRKKVERLRIESENNLIVTMTFGIAYCTEKKDSSCQSKKMIKIDELIRIADNRLYEGKRTGKNVVVYR